MLLKGIEKMGIELEQSSDEELAHLYADKLHELEIAGGYEIHHKQRRYCRVWVFKC